MEKKSSAPPTPLPMGISDISFNWLRSCLEAIEKSTEKDVLAIFGNMVDDVAILTNLALERLENPREKLLVILDTPGGSIESVKQIVQTIRHFYKTVHFLVPVRAMSAGTVLVMSGDAIYMDYFSRLGPIDPQIQRGNAYVPGLSYLRKYKEMNEKAAAGNLTNADAILLQKLDFAELDQIELAKNLSESLITEWLSRYKFKNWNKTKTKGQVVNEEMRQKRAKEIASILNNQEKWFVHGYGINKDVLEKDLRLEIDDYGEDTELKSLIWKYYWPAAEHVRLNNYSFFVQSRGL